MEYLRQIEEDLTSLGNEAKKRHPEIKDSTDRAIATLKIIRETYVSEVMRKTASTTSKKFNFPQSSDLIAPYILTCNYAEASSKIVRLLFFLVS